MPRDTLVGAVVSTLIYLAFAMAPDALYVRVLGRGPNKTIRRVMWAVALIALIGLVVGLIFIPFE